MLRVFEIGNWTSVKIGFKSDPKPTNPPNLTYDPPPVLLLHGHGRLPRVGHLLAQRRLPQRREVLFLHVRHSLRKHELPPHRRAGRLLRSRSNFLTD